MRFFFTIIALFTGCVCSGQVNTFTPIEVGVNWDKTTHILFPTAIKYFSTVSEYIVADNIDNILSIKANEEDFTGKSSLTVATADGQFYAFSISYSRSLEKTTLVIGDDKTIIPQRLQINTKNDIHLLFPAQVKYIDYGSDAIIASPTQDLQNIVRISAPEPFDFSTNVTVCTEKGEFYTFDIIYDEAEENFTYYIGNQMPDTPALLKKEDLTDYTKQEIAEKLNQKGRTIYTLGIKKNKISFSIHNVFIRGDKLLLRIEIANVSNVKYDIDYIKFYIVDKKKNRRTASQEIEVIPLFIENEPSIIDGQSTAIFSVCFEKFTIPDNKYFTIEVNERNGGRHINYRLSNTDIINAEAF